MIRLLNNESMCCPSYHMDNQDVKMEGWSICNLSAHTMGIIKSLEFEEMTPVQSATIPIFLKNKDVAVEAVTGSGKTLAFVIPILEMMLKQAKNMKKHEMFSIIISPTRELASQISEVVAGFLSGEASSFTHMLLIGGRGEMSKDTDAFEENGAHIVIGTPGRINSAFETSKLFCSAARSLEILILDEADRLLDLGFHKTLTSILSFLPKQRRTGLFSATQTEETEKLVKAGLRNPVKIIVKQKISNTEDACVRTPTTLKNYYLICSTKEKFNKLMQFLKSHKNEKFLVFFSTCAAVDYFGRAIKEFLLKDKTEVFLLHGKMKKKRLQIFSDFRSKTSGILICTDVMARGVDIPEVNWVLQFDPPSSASAFVHRCGRTARIGKQGNALIFLLENEASYVDFMQINQKAPIFEYKELTDSSEIDYLKKLQNLSTSDRAMMERGTRAFVSFVQSYAKHECSLIFRLKDIDFGELASGFALLQLPRMPELKSRRFINFQPPDVNISEIKYKDKAREKQRKAELLKRQSGEFEQKNKRPFVNKSWSKNKQRLEKKHMRKEYKRKRKLREANEFNEKELDELEDDARLVKKLKKGKITQEEFDEKMKLTDVLK